MSKLLGKCPKCGGELDTAGVCHGFTYFGESSGGARGGCGYRNIPIPFGANLLTEMNDVKHFLFEDESTWKAKYEMLVSGEYGAFEMWGSDGEIEGYRGFRKNFGTTEVYPTYREAIEAALEDFSEDE